MSFAFDKAHALAMCILAPGNMAGGGLVSGPVVIANNAGSMGTLNIGAGAGSPAVAPGTLDTTSVAFGAGAGTLNFNHTSSDYVFAPAISGPGTVNVLAGTCGRRQPQAGLA